MITEVKKNTSRQVDQVPACRINFQGGIRNFRAKINLGLLHIASPNFAVTTHNTDAYIKSLVNPGHYKKRSCIGRRIGFSPHYRYSGADQRCPRQMVWNAFRWNAKRHNGTADATNYTCSGIEYLTGALDIAHFKVPTSGESICHEYISDTPVILRRAGSANIRTGANSGAGGQITECYIRSVR